MENAKILIYDGSFNGFLSAIYMAFDGQIAVADIQQRSRQQKFLFGEPLVVFTHVEKAKRVWQGIDRRQYQAAKKIYFAFLSERKGVELLLYQFIRALFAQAGCNTGQEVGTMLHKIEALAEMVALEKKRIEATLAFHKEEGQLALATISPDHNVLPLISRYFRSLSPHSDWIIYDRKRRYGLYYHQHSMKLLPLNPAETDSLLAKMNGRIFGNNGKYLSKDDGKQPTRVRKLGNKAQQGSFQEKRAV